MYLSSRARDEYISAVGHGINISQLQGPGKNILYLSCGGKYEYIQTEGPGMNISQLHGMARDEYFLAAIY